MSDKQYRNVYDIFTEVPDGNERVIDEAEASRLIVALNVSTERCAKFMEQHGFVGPDALDLGGGVHAMLHHAFSTCNSERIIAQLILAGMNSDPTKFNDFFAAYFAGAMALGVAFALEAQQEDITSESPKGFPNVPPIITEE